MNRKKALWSVFAAALIAVSAALGCVVAWMPLGSPAGVYDAPEYALLEDGAKALFVVSKDHTCFIKFYNKDPLHTPIVFDGTWEKDPEDGMFHFVFQDDHPQTDAFEKKGKCHLWGMKMHDTEWDGTPRTFHFRRKLFDFPASPAGE